MVTDACMMADMPGFCESQFRDQYTCGEIKEAYTTSSCCGNPERNFTFSSSRRLSSETSPHKSNILINISVALKRAYMIGGKKKVAELAAGLRNVIQSSSPF